ncbi:9596_t:CDS:2, partial [Racocetra persica]
RRRNEMSRSGAMKILGRGAIRILEKVYERLGHNENIRKGALDIGAIKGYEVHQKIGRNENIGKLEKVYERLWRNKILEK